MEFKPIPNDVVSKGHTYDISKDLMVRSISKKGVIIILKPRAGSVKINGKWIQTYKLAQEAGWPPVNWPEDVEEWEELPLVSKQRIRYRIFKSSRTQSMDQYGKVITMTHTLEPNGYMKVKIAGKNWKVHQLMGMTNFVPKPIEANKSWSVDHLDNKPKNNHADNLVWKSHPDQSINRRPPEQSQNDSYPVIGTALKKIILSNEEIIEMGDSKQFEHTTDAAKQTNGHRNAIFGCINNYRKSHAGFVWSLPPNDDDLPGEGFISIFKTYQYERLISFNGRIKYAFNNGYEKIVWAKDTLSTRDQQERDWYPRFSINGRNIQFHRAVLELVIDIPNNIVVDHIDDIKSNARLGNLQLLTQSENIKKYHLKTYKSSVASFIDKKHEKSHKSKKCAIEYIQMNGYPEATLIELNIELMFLKICDIPAIVYGRTWIPAHFEQL